jgi:hypothetical protein
VAEGMPNLGLIFNKVHGCLNALGEGHMIESIEQLKNDVDWLIMRYEEMLIDKTPQQDGHVYFKHVDLLFELRAFKLVVMAMHAEQLLAEIENLVWHQENKLDCAKTNADFPWSRRL